MTESKKQSDSVASRLKSPKDKAMNKQNKTTVNGKPSTDLNSNELGSRVNNLSLEDSTWDEAAALEMYEDELSQAFELPPTQFTLLDNNRMKYTNNQHQPVSETIGDAKSDITVKVGKEDFKVHKHILIAASDYFKDWQSKSAVDVKDVTEQGFSSLLTYVYTGTVIIDEKNVQNIFKAIRHFKVTWIDDACYDYIAHHLAFTNYETALKIAEGLSLDQIKPDIYRFMGHSITQLVEQPNFFKDLSLKLLMEFIQNDIYVDIHERFLLELVLHWVEANKSDRKANLRDLLKPIRFGLMEFDELEDLPADVTQYPEVKSKIEAAQSYTLDIPAQAIKKENMFLQRGSHPSVMILSFTAAGKFLTYKNPDHQGLYQEELGMTGLQLDYECASQTTLGNFVYAAGGYDERMCAVSRMFRFDPKFRDWVELASMQQGRVSFAMCSSDRNIYAIGGILHYFIDENEEKEEVLSTVEMYSPEDNSWKMVEPLPRASFDQSATFLDGHVYISGGISPDHSDPVPLQTAYCLDVKTNKWKSLSPMNTQRQGHNMTSYKGKVYVIGGYTCSDTPLFKDCHSNEVYDPQTNQWTEVKRSPESMGHILRSSGNIGSKVYFLSRNSDKKFLYSYDFEQDKFDDGEEVDKLYQKLTILNTAYPSIV